MAQGNFTGAPLQDQDLNSTEWKRWFQKLSTLLTGPRPLPRYDRDQLPRAREYPGALIYVDENNNSRSLCISDDGDWETIWNSND